MQKRNYNNYNTPGNTRSERTLFMYISTNEPPADSLHYQREQPKQDGSKPKVMIAQPQGQPGQKRIDRRSRLHSASRRKPAVGIERAVGKTHPDHFNPDEHQQSKVKRNTI